MVWFLMLCICCNYIIKQFISMSAAGNPYVIGWKELDPHLHHMILDHANRRIWWEDVRLELPLPHVWDNLADFEEFKEALEEYQNNDDEGDDENEGDSRVRMVRKYVFERSNKSILGPVTVSFGESVYREYYHGFTADMTPIYAALDRTFSWSGICKIRMTEYEDEDGDEYLMFQFFRRRQNGQEESVQIPAEFLYIQQCFDFTKDIVAQRLVEVLHMKHREVAGVDEFTLGRFAHET